MGDLIERDWVLKRMVLEPDYEVVQMAPAVDAEPVRHGRWEVFYEDWRKQLSGYQCSACGYTFFGCGSGSYEYCSYCGAKMDGGADDEN